jgi:hypothetical protein
MHPLVVRSALDRAALRTLRLASEAAFASATEWALTHGLSGPNLSGSLPFLFQAFERSEAASIARDLLGPDLVVPLDHLLFRFMPPRSDHAGNSFHQDYDLIPKQFPLNVWIPLSRIDQYCLGLSFILPPSPVALPLPIDVEAYLREREGIVLTPDMDVGDLVIFNHLTIHGSFIVPKPAPRYSVEFRIGNVTELGDYADKPLWRLSHTA